MLQKYNRWIVAQQFFDDPAPEGGFSLREVSRKAKIAPTSVKKYLKELEKEGFITRTRSRQGFPVYYANRENERYVFYKRINTLSTIYESGLIDYLYKACLPDAIVLFGSAARGEDTKGSDIDLFLLCKEKKIELHQFEKNTGRSINILFSENFDSLSSELKNNILNGIKLKGYIKVF